MYTHAYSWSIYLEYMHAYILACMHTFSHTCVQAYIHTYIPTYLHTYTHTYTLSDIQGIQSRTGVRAVDTYIHRYIDT